MYLYFKFGWVFSWIGSFLIGDPSLSCIDLVGTYSLLPKNKNHIMNLIQGISSIMYCDFQYCDFSKLSWNIWPMTFQKATVVSSILQKKKKHTKIYSNVLLFFGRIEDTAISWPSVLLKPNYFKKQWPFWTCIFTSGKVKVMMKNVASWNNLVLSINHACFKCRG